MSTVEVVGSGPAVESLVAALAETPSEVVRREDPLTGDADLSVVVGQVTADLFGTANERARATGTPWVAVELGGIGGVPVTDAAIAGFGPQTGCYDCLTERVRSNADQQSDPAGAPAASTQRFAGAVAGRRIEQALAGEGVVVGTVLELPHTERQFLPVPGCACRDAERWTLTHAGDRDHDREALSRAEAGLDERVGIVRNVGEAESFPAPYYLAELTDTARFSDVTAPQQAAGVATDWDSAFMKALGESYERYAAGVYRAAEMVSGTGEAVAERLDPAEFVAPDGGAWGGGEAVPWVPAENLGTGTQRLAPAEVVVYPPPSHAVRPATTTGLGLGSSETDALLSGLYEVVERDAAMLSWYATYDPLEVVVEGNETFDALRRRARSEDLDVTALLLTQDVDVPVVAVALERETWPKFALGSSARLDPAEAAVGALEEALQNWMELRGMGPEDAADADGAIGWYADRPEAAASLTETATAVPISSVGPDSVPTGGAELDELVDRVVDAGLSPFASRLTTPDLELMGFEAVRAFCPTAQPLFFDESYFGDRTETVPTALGFEPRLGRDHHPFP
ncbi:YcaO-like family protein [Haloarcula pellucida]|uniref:Bacteriocin biosynthesis protein SagD n=1 Tax=Haloarcula pellucida TaxID=1427151 RepID=A0A830GKE3_9EURY|nr:YcaO-like family protein [Halomicroarcula pellucida]MBX0347699.1 YcaO-like family protein [Halomicroarcula pellucida]GGN89917.1 bacteriocin biosynthesis protein SagD [Halomicroarcula pellucida]